MAEAQIIPFPPRPQAAEGSDRLRRAIGDLQDALLAQSQALTDWRLATTELGFGVAALAEALGRTRLSLAAVQDRLAGIRANAESLARWDGAALLEAATRL